MKKYSHHSELGVSIIEILIVLVISSILATAAISLFGGAKENLRRQNVAREFKISLERARFDSVKRHATDESTRSAVTIIDETSYSVTTDLNQNGLLDPSESTIVTFSGSPQIRLLLQPGVTVPVTIAFDQRGHATVGDYNENPADHFYFCDTGCTPANATRSNSNMVSISPTGTAVMVGGGESLTAVSDPTVSVLANTSGINPDVTVWTGTPPTPTPTPVPSPTPTPVSTPVPTPTPTPTGSPTPTPEPTPRPACVLNQRPDDFPGCQCNSPWFVGRNGKCGP